MHALAIIHLKDEFLETYVQTWLPILALTLRRPPDRPTKVRRKELDEPQTKKKVEQDRGGYEVHQMQKNSPNLATGYPKSAREYPKSIGCPNSPKRC
ncbi:hypothetical protein Goshw_026203 [Gossypium schwendimanii]|uniref:Uncharacterized protein n=1 Tax=Gossypium schwendimanii TaxID=34291 RepID=A0A7J9KUH7_GOSSC|nr:hypothetical protein [Gossypium schwendimanii]